MKVVDVERIVIDVPFTPRQQEITKASVYRWSTLELCKVTTDSGHVGWGETAASCSMAGVRSSAS